MRVLLVGGCLALVAACSSVPQVPDCTVTPDPVKTKEVYAVSLTKGSPGTTVVLRFNSADGSTTKKTLVIDSNGNATYKSIAEWAGTSVIEVVDKDTESAAVLTTCVLRVADATGCGDGACGAQESCSSCFDDCGACEASCGDGLCDAAETCTLCEEDCGPCTSACGDGTCNANESCQNCAVDCDACSAESCGDATCAGGETCTTCQADCGTCPASCGNKACDGGETCSSCPTDCGVCPPSCGDFLCNGTETCSTCAGDCGTCTACDPAASSTATGRHDQGLPCIGGCHEAGGRASGDVFTVAGTVFSSASATTTVVGATVTIVDADGQSLKLVSAKNGNFYTNKSVKLPLRVRASKCPAVNPMNGDVIGDGADCNVCHKAGNRIYVK